MKFAIALVESVKIGIESGIAEGESEIAESVSGATCRFDRILEFLFRTLDLRTNLRKRLRNEKLNIFFRCKYKMFIKISSKLQKKMCTVRVGLAFFFAGEEAAVGDAALLDGELDLFLPMLLLLIIIN